MSSPNVRKLPRGNFLLRNLSKKNKEKSASESSTNLSDEYAEYESDSPMENKDCVEKAKRPSKRQRTTSAIAETRLGSMLKKKRRRTGTVELPNVPDYEGTSISFPNLNKSTSSPITEVTK